MVRLTGIWSGCIVVLAVTLVSLVFSFAHSAFDPLVISIIIGIFLSNLIGGSSDIRVGIETCLRFSLPSGIALYGMQLDFSGFQMENWSIVGASFVLMFAISYLFSRYVTGLGPDLSLLIASGLSICGASAIVVIASAAGARREETSISIISVMIAGLTGMVIYRLMAGTSLLSSDGVPMVVGTTLPMLGQVKVAARAFGQDALEMAVNYKLIRVSALPLVALLVMAMGGKKSVSGGRPWFMAVFFLLALLSNVSGDIASLRGVAGHLSAFLLTAALASIGLSVDLDTILQKGMAPPVAAGVSWGLTATIISLAIALML
jgi:uncharacterized integral membrane protein (TIGR00698 family)